MNEGDYIDEIIINFKKLLLCILRLGYYLKNALEISINCKTNP